MKLAWPTSFGPNSFPAHNSVIDAGEVQVEYIAKALFAPIIDHGALTMEVKEEAEEKFVYDVDQRLAGSSFLLAARIGT